MKKKLEADLIRIANRVLTMETKSDIDSLYAETQHLLEKLAVLRFVESYLDETKPAIKQDDTPKEPITTPLLKKEERSIKTEAMVEEKEKSEVIVPPLNLDLKPLEIKKNKLAAPEAVQISFDELIGSSGLGEDLFVKVTEGTKNNIVAEVTPPAPEIEKSKGIEKTTSLANSAKAKSTTDAKKIRVDLNDRIAFTQHLFNNSLEDYNRVFNQLLTFETFEETRDFILAIVKPDYNHWEGKEEYETRLMEIIEKRFF